MTNVAGTRTLADLKTYVKRAFGDESGVQVTDNDIIGWCDTGIARIASELPIKEMVASYPYAVGTSGFSLPTDFLRLVAIQAGNNILTRSDFSDVARMQGGAATLAGGTPAYYYLFGNTVTIYPMPNTSGNLNLFYIGKPVEAVSDNDVIDMPDEYFDILCDYVMGRAYELDENPSMMTAKMNAFNEQVKKLTGKEREDEGSFPITAEYHYEGGDWCIAW